MKLHNKIRYMLQLSVCYIEHLIECLHSLFHIVPMLFPSVDVYTQLNVFWLHIVLFSVLLTAHSHALTVWPVSDQLL